MQSRLIIKKRQIQATTELKKPGVHAIARLPKEVGKVMLEIFGHEMLFQKPIIFGGKRLEKGKENESDFEKKLLDAFYKRDESLEITVRSLLIGQTYIGDSIWDALAFEVIVKRAFDTLLQLVEAVGEFDSEIVYEGQSQMREEDVPAECPAQISTNESRLKDVAASVHRAMAQKDEILT